MSDTPPAARPHDLDTRHELEAADLLGFVLAGRPERIEDGLLAIAGPPARVGVRSIREVLTTLGRCMPPDPPSLELRAKLRATCVRAHKKARSERAPGPPQACCVRAAHRGQDHLVAVLMQEEGRQREAKVGDA